MGADGNDFLVGGAGRDGLVGGEGVNSYIGGFGDDVIIGGSSTDIIAAFNITTDGADDVDLRGGADVFNVSASSPTNVRLSFTSAEVGNGSATDSGTLANQDGGRAVRLQAETAGTPAGPITRVDDEGITFIGGAGVTFDVRDLVTGAARGEAFEVVALGTAGTDMMTAVQPSRPYYFNAGAGDDTIMGADGNDFLVGGAGRDGLAGGEGDNSYIGGFGDDVIIGGGGRDTIAAFNITTDGADHVNLGGGQDIVNVSASSATNVRLSFISANVGNGDPNEPQVTAPPSGVDGGLAVRLQAETNGTPGGPISRFDDEGITFVAGAGVTFDVRDFVSGAQRGEAFEVVVLGSAGADVLTAVQASRPYYFNAGAGNDTVLGGDAFDFLVGGAGDDTLRGGGSADSFLGGGGADFLDGGQGGDTLLGGDGDDIIMGGVGDDTMAGEAGADDFMYKAGDGFDTIIGYDKGAGGDQIIVNGYTQAQATITQEGADVRVRFSAATPSCCWARPRPASPARWCSGPTNRAARAPTS
jgi:Ca2+-binding RTX toxin-like protein